MSDILIKIWQNLVCLVKYTESRVNLVSRINEIKIWQNLVSHAKIWQNLVTW